MCSGSWTPGKSTVPGSGKIAKRVGNSGPAMDAQLYSPTRGSASSEHACERAAPGRDRRGAAAPPRAAARPELRSAAARALRREPPSEAALRDLLRGRDDQDPAAQRAQRRAAARVVAGGYAVPRARAPEALRSRRALRAALPQDPRVRAAPRRVSTQLAFALAEHRGRAPPADVFAAAGAGPCSSGPRAARAVLTLSPREPRARRRRPRAYRDRR